MSPTSRELLLAYRWPAAVVVSSVVLAATAIQILSKPIPIRIEGGLQVDKLVLPASVTIRSNEPLPVAVREDVVITGTTPLAVQGQVQVGGEVQANVRSIETPVQVNAAVSVNETVNVNGKVNVGGKVSVEGNVGAKVKPTLLPMPGLGPSVAGGCTVSPKQPFFPSRNLTKGESRQGCNDDTNGTPYPALA